VKILWTEPAAAVFHKLSRRVQLSILDRLDAVEDFPEMYPVRERQPYAGFRYFFTEGWCVSYVVAEDSLVILAVFSASRG